MATKEQEFQNIPLAAGNGHAHRDTEATTVASHDAREQRRKKRRKWLLYIVLFIIFQSAVIAVFSLTIMKIRRPKLSVRGATFENFTLDSSAAAKPTLAARMNVELRLKNSNFGRYKYKATNITFVYRGTPVGEAAIGESRVSWQSKKRIFVAVDLDFAAAQSDPQLVSDLNAGVVPISGHATVRGKVELLFVFKKSKSTEMNCSTYILTASQKLNDIACG
ncbi:late embryogenesis abundant protein At1g64065-like [Henckelia pumila]|uniref:late embryogenesis abundant protein At1g64065-like n=1 Tax=Henckelia pumila TaxID=405737 RepID=UPI003C6E2F4A